MSTCCGSLDRYLRSLRDLQHQLMGELFTALQYSLGILTGAGTSKWDLREEKVTENGFTSLLAAGGGVGEG